MDIIKKYIEEQLKQSIKNQDGHQHNIIFDFMIYHIKLNNNYYFCQVDEEKLNDITLNIDEINDFVKIIDWSSKQDPIEALHDMFNFTIEDTTNAYIEIPLFYKKTNEKYNFLVLDYQNNKLIGKAWREI